MRKEELSIIIVDDLQFSREVVKSSLGKFGFIDIRTASSADEAMYLLNQRRAHVVLADFWMPGMNGLEMTDLIRRWDESNHRYTGIILLTAEDAASNIVVAFDRGVDDFVSKSANQFELSARVYGLGRAVLRQNRLRQRMRELSENLLQARDFCMLDTQTRLANRPGFELQVESMIEHCSTRGGGLGVALVRMHYEDKDLPASLLRAMANSLQLSLRPLDVISRFDSNTFAIAIDCRNPGQLNAGLFQRRLHETPQQLRYPPGQPPELKISVGIWYSNELDPAPTIEEVIKAALEDLHAANP